MFIECDGVAGFDEFGGGGLEVLLADSVEGDAVFWAACHGSGYHEGAGFDPVRDDGVLCAVEFFYSGDGDAAGAGAFDAGAHFVEEVG